ncbi:hypothetical protein B0A55_00577 [Friedmanniomyces simplex]|uniref:thioredoxin-dependent peroxiredoxin n=1 Tax=Friedmanniomyces simplex TaxID=329884 RepID=A0A4U0XZH3_9PEZI|nr:hypothetical protein B0A55_00577 [Friedmanniomyces simplex]
MRRGGGARWPGSRAQPAGSASAPPPKAKKAATTKSKAKKEDAAAAAVAKESKPPASNPAKDAKAGIPDGAGGVSATAEITGADVAKEVAAKVETEAVKGKKGAKSGKAGSATTETPKTGGSVELEGFGEEVETNDGEKTTLAKLVEESKAGVVLFTYPKASTPGCIKQACLFRDAYSPLSATGLSIYGLSTDSPKSNTTFKTKQKLPYPLLCDPSATLISAIGFKSGKSTTRGVFVVDKSGKVLAADAGGPQATVDIVKEIVEKMGGDGNAEGLQKAEERAGGEGEGAGKSAADTAAEVADTAEKIDA